MAKRTTKKTTTAKKAEAVVDLPTEAKAIEAAPKPKGAPDWQPHAKALVEAASMHRSGDLPSRVQEAVKLLKMELR